MSSARAGQSPASVCVDMWEKSPGHLANILRNSDMVAVGITFQQSGTFYCTQTFGAPKSGVGATAAGSRCTAYGVTPGNEKKADPSGRDDPASPAHELTEKPAPIQPHKRVQTPLGKSAALPTYPKMMTPAPSRAQHRKTKRYNNAQDSEMMSVTECMQDCMSSSRLSPRESSASYGERDVTGCLKRCMPSFHTEEL